MNIRALQQLGKEVDGHIGALALCSAQMLEVYARDPFGGESRSGQCTAYPDGTVGASVGTLPVTVAGVKMYVKAQTTSCRMPVPRGEDKRFASDYAQVVLQGHPHGQAWPVMTSFNTQGVVTGDIIGVERNRRTLPAVPDARASFVLSEERTEAHALAHTLRLATAYAGVHMLGTLLRKHSRVRHGREQLYTAMEEGSALLRRCLRLVDPDRQVCVLDDDLPLKSIAKHPLVNLNKRG